MKYWSHVVQMNFRVASYEYPLINTLMLCTVTFVLQKCVFFYHNPHIHTNLQ